MPTNPINQRRPSTTDILDTALPGLAPALECLVPLRMMELVPLPDDELVRRANGAATEIGSHADGLLFGKPKTRSEHATRAETLNQLVTGLAAAALLAEGGVTWCGMHWCAAEHEGCPSRPVLHRPLATPKPRTTPTPRPVTDVPLPEAPTGEAA